MFLLSYVDKRILSTNIGMTAVTLIFIGLLAFLYFTKKNMDNLENKVYKLLMIGILIELGCDLYCRVVQYNGPILSTTIEMLEKLRIYALVAFYFFMNIYRMIVVKNKDKRLEIKYEANKKKIYIISLILIAILTIMAIALPSGLEISKVENVAIIADSSFLYICMLIFALELLSYIIIAIYSIGKIDKKKLIPFIVIDIFLIGIYFDTELSYYIVSILGRALVVFVMYHTLENPDVKMVKELELAKNQAEQSNNAKSDFLSSMSHELRTPLNAIVGLSQMIDEEATQDEVKKDAKDIIVASENLLELVNGILDINKLEANQVEKLEQNYNPREILNKLENMISIRIGDKNITLRTRFSEDLPEYLYGDKENIKRIISNLLTNAVKYTNEGYIDFNVDCTVIKDKCNLIITVTDTGRGIAEERIPTLFTKFNRLESDKDSDISGTGLGLAITKSLVDLLGGKISVNSTVGEGTTFTVTLSQKVVDNIDIL